MKIFLIIIMITTEIKCALFEFKRKLIESSEEYSMYVKKIKTDNLNNRRHTSVTKSSVEKKADCLYEKTWDIYKHFSGNNSDPYDNKFISIRELSKKFISNYDIVTKMNTYDLLERDSLNIFKILEEKSIDITFKSFLEEYEISKKTPISKGVKFLDELVLIELIKMQKNYSLIPELMIIVNLTTYKIHNVYLLSYLRIFNLYLDTYILNNDSVLKYKENIFSFIEGIYEHTMKVPNCIKKYRGLKLEVGKCKKDQSELLGIFISNLAYNQRYALKERNNSELFLQTPKRTQYFLITCYLLLFRHLMLIVIVQNKNYDVTLIDEFMNKYFNENVCIGCMIEDCFNILKLPVN